MFILDERQELLLRKHCAGIYRAMGVKSFNEYEPHKLTWAELNKQSAEAFRSARAMLDKITDDMVADEAKSIEGANNAILEIIDAIANEKDARTEIGNRSPRKMGGSPRAPKGEDVTVGESDEDGAETFALRKDQSMRGFILSRGGDQENYRNMSPGSYVRAMIMGPKNDQEKRALSEGTDSAGGYTTPEILSAQLIDRLRSKSVCFQAGAQLLPLLSDNNNIAKIVTDPTPAWRAENASVANSDPTFIRVTLVPRSLAVMFQVSRELLQDSLNMDEAITTVMTNALALELDRVALTGTGTAPQPRGILNFTGLTTTTFSTAPHANYVPIVNMRTALRGANSDPTAFILSTRDEGKLANAVDTTGQPLRVPEAIINTPRLATTSVPTNLGAGTNESWALAGDFSELLIGIRSEIRIEVLKERYADTLQYGFIAWMRADVVAKHEAAFTKITAILP